MGLVSKVFGGGGSNAASKAAKEGAAIMRQFYDEGRERILPYQQAAVDALPSLQMQATPEGYFSQADGPFREYVDQLIQPVIGERLRDTQSMLGASGMRRSGAGVKSIASTVGDTEFEFLTSILQMMRQREMGLVGASSAATSNLGALGQKHAFDVSDTLGQGILGDAQYDAQLTTAIANAVGQAASYGMGRV